MEEVHDERQSQSQAKGTVLATSADVNSTSIIMANVQQSCKPLKPVKIGLEELDSNKLPSHSKETLLKVIVGPKS